MLNAAMTEWDKSVDSHIAYMLWLEAPDKDKDFTPNWLTVFVAGWNAALAAIEEVAPSEAEEVPGA